MVVESVESLAYFLKAKQSSKFHSASVGLIHFRINAQSKVLRARPSLYLDVYWCTG